MLGCCIDVEEMGDNEEIEADKEEDECEHNNG